MEPTSWVRWLLQELVALKLASDAQLVDAKLASNAQLAAAKLASDAQLADANRQLAMRSREIREV